MKGGAVVNGDAQAVTRTNAEEGKEGMVVGFVLVNMNVIVTVQTDWQCGMHKTVAILYMYIINHKGIFSIVIWSEK